MTRVPELDLWKVGELRGPHTFGALAQTITDGGAHRRRRRGPRRQRRALDRENLRQRRVEPVERSRLESGIQRERLAEGLGGGGVALLVETDDAEQDPRLDALGDRAGGRLGDATQERCGAIQVARRELPAGRR